MNRNLRSVSLAPLLEEFFCEYLISQRNSCPATVSSYRDTFRLLLRFVEQRFGSAPALSTFADFGAPQILAFLDYLEHERKNSVRSRNARLAAIRSFMQYAALQEPTALSSIQQVLAIPQKRFDRPALDYPSREEVAALLAAPDTTTWSGHRDQVLFATMYNTGARVSEITGLNREDFQMRGTATLRIRGKGRKERVVPLWKITKAQIREWLPRIQGQPATPLFPSRRGDRLTRSGVRTRLQAAVDTAVAKCRNPTWASRLSASTAAQLRHAPPPGRVRHERHCPVAGTREPPHNAYVRGSGPTVEEESA